ncbi:uncharacterized protein H6S33_012852 [Morchella sextelata]|uniref:uncharacterized protein n=1 Tax=Morchella sextelata TaxID=1174677 RepID=UPI001D049088|nr:uncharacterized protein H6S33_012852 [Morchella sextelata]KAH0609366.1 hypothetical protein H6S33_012852 [Morchella sextelata]
MSASFGSPSSSVHPRVHPSSSSKSNSTHGVVTTADPKSTSTTLSSTASASRSTNNNSPLSSSSTTISPSSSHPHRQPKYPQDVATTNPTSTTAPRNKKTITYRHSTGQSEQSRHEVINLDSDTETSSSSKKNSNPSLSSARNRQSLQPPYDPIPRGSTGASTKSAHRASASPSIASLIDPQPPPPQLSTAPTENPITNSPTLAYVTGVPEKNVMKVENISRSADAGEPLNRSPKSKPGTAPPSAAPSPKPHRAVPASTSGNGLLGGVLPGASGSKEIEPQLPNIHIHVPLNGENNKYINFTKLAEERYGWAALNPRLAKARERMMRGDNSGDEMMMDGSESESNMEVDKPMGGVDSAAEGKKMRKKRKNQDIYDKNDPFIDDTEMLWEEQAAASKDGFFVYSGPLVPEGEKPQIERADGTVKRGRGRARGTTARGTTSTRGATIRKPRMSKKDKEKMEKEKEEREKFSQLAAKATAGQ